MVSEVTFEKKAKAGTKTLLKTSWVNLSMCFKKYMKSGSFHKNRKTI